MNDHHAATIDSFDPTRGFGTARLADGRVLNFDASVAFARLAELAPGAAVLVELGQSRRTGESTIVRLWFAGREPAAPASEEPLTATPEQTLAALRAAGLASKIDVARFREACLAEWRAEQAGWPNDDEDDEDDEDEDDEDDDDEPEAFEANTLLAALASLHGTQGPTDTSAAEGIFLVDENAADDPEVQTRVQAVLEQWLGRPLPAQVTPDLEDMVYYVGDTLHLRQHAAGPDETMLYASEGVRAADDLAFTVYARLENVDALRAVPFGFSPRLSPDTEAAAAGIFRYDGCDLAFAEHAPACAVCQANLAAVARTNQLPQAFAALIVQ